MNNPPNDAPDLTAYALGELSADQAREVHAMLAALPTAQSELEHIEAVTDALRQGAPIPLQRLTPDQRHAVLHPAQMPRFVGPMMPRQVPRRKPALFWPAVRSLAQAAAIIAIGGVAFLLGRNVSINQSPAPVASAPTAPETADSQATAAAPAQAEVPIRPAAAVASVEISGPPAVLAKLPAPKPPVTATPAPVPAPAAVVAAAPVVPPSPSSPPPPVVAAKPAPPAVQNVAVGFTTPPANDLFVNASRRAGEQLSFKPAQIRPLPARQDRSQQFASPAPVKPAPDAKAGKGRPADLYIHSWKADVTTCPWNEANRLLRVAIQLPADQPAASSDFAYPIQVTFDPNAVREYRMLCERHQPAPELRSAGLHVIWYEYLPNGAAEPNRENGRQVATVTLPGAKFTIQAVEPFDGSRLRVLDRGQSWQSAREDFTFETAVVGFGMLLRGAPQTGSLNHQLVLNLASKSKGAEPDPERMRFIRLVKEARQAAGL